MHHYNAKEALNEQTETTKAARKNEKGQLSVKGAALRVEVVLGGFGEAGVVSSGCGEGLGWAG